jgi:hypothetical protein
MLSYRLRVQAFLMSGLFLLLQPQLVSAQETMDIGIIGAESGMSALDFDAARTSFFYQHDRDGDFSLSFPEMSEAMLNGGSRLFDGYDLDGDGLVSFDEYVQSGMDVFRSMDLDGDGILSSMEM